MGAKMSFLAPKVRNFDDFPILGAKMELFPFCGVNFAKEEFPGALDDGKGSDRALATGKGMPF